MAFHDTYTNWLKLGNSSFLLSLLAHAYGCRMYFGTVCDVASDLKVTKMTSWILKLLKLHISCLTFSTHYYVSVNSVFTFWHFLEKLIKKVGTCKIIRWIMTWWTLDRDVLYHSKPEVCSGISGLNATTKKTPASWLNTLKNCYWSSWNEAPLRSGSSPNPSSRGKNNRSSRSTLLK